MVQKQPSLIIYFKNLLPQPFGLFTLACLIGIFLYLVSMSITNPEYRKKYDPYDYAKVGESIWNGKGIALEGKPYVLLPPGFPFIVGAINKIIGDPEIAVKVTGIIFWVLSLFLFYVFLGYFFSEQLYRWMGILLYASNYPMLFSASAGRVEPVFLFFLLFYVVLLMKTSSVEKKLQRPLTFLFLLAALAAMLYYLRPEGLYLSLVLFVIFLWQLSITRVKKFFYSVYFLGLVFVLIAPYIFFLRVHTGHFQLSGKTYANLIMGEMESPYQSGIYDNTTIPYRYTIIERIINNPAEARTFNDYLNESHERLFQRIIPNLQSLILSVMHTVSVLGIILIFFGIKHFSRRQQIMLWGILSIFGLYLLFYILNRLIAIYQPFLAVMMIGGMISVTEWLKKTQFHQSVIPLKYGITLVLMLYQMRSVCIS